MPDGSSAALLTLPVVALVSFTFLFGGVVKGVIGLGLPPVALAFLAPTLGLKEAMSIMLVPCIIANIWQGLAGGFLKELLAKLWSFLLLAAIGVWTGVLVLAAAPVQVITVIFGATLCSYSIFSLLRPQLPPPGKHEWWGSPVSGGLGGFMFGMTGSFIVPGILYLQALGLNRNMFVQSMGLTFIVISSALVLSMNNKGLLPDGALVLSTMALIPTGVGLLLGQRYRHRISEEMFRKLFFSGLVLIGLYMMLRAFG